MIVCPKNVNWDYKNLTAGFACPVRSQNLMLPDHDWLTLLITST